MKLNKYKLGDLITQRREKNPGGVLPICGVSKNGIIPPKQVDADVSIYNVLYKKDFIFNPARMELNSIAYNDKFDKAICSSMYEVFYVHREDIVNPEYLKLIIKTDWFTRYCKFLGQGSVREYCRFANISEIEIKLPNIEEQRKIVKVYNDIENRMLLKKNINDNLLEQALTLYNKKFTIRDKNGCIGDYCSVKSGFAFKSSWWKDEGIKVIKIGSINQDNLNLLECSYVSEDKIEKAKDFQVTAGDLLIAMTGTTIGKFSMVPYSSETLLVNQRVGKFFLGENPVKKLPFIYCTLKQPDVYYEMINRGQGSAQPNISGYDIMSIPCFIPDKEIIKTFNDTIYPLFNYIISNQHEYQQLSILKDTILPKLMSGKIDTSSMKF